MSISNPANIDGGEREKSANTIGKNLLGNLLDGPRSPGRDQHGRRNDRGHCNQIDTAQRKGRNAGGVPARDDVDNRSRNGDDEADAKGSACAPHPMVPTTRNGRPGFGLYDG